DYYCAVGHPSAYYIF
nr:immunoglobulin light chain junction region [Macaca mulatta]MOX78424.1 immunoglobulin light chain junction region [Macaca mulatta]MOX81734.1 immunoglobulin light chain junction region [Macaca mulatta]